MCYREWPAEMVRVLCTHRTIDSATAQSMKHPTARSHESSSISDFGFCPAFLEDSLGRQQAGRQAGRWTKAAHGIAAARAGHKPCAAKLQQRRWWKGSPTKLLLSTVPDQLDLQMRCTPLSSDSAIRHSRRTIHQNHSHQQKYELSTPWESLDRDNCWRVFSSVAGQGIYPY